MDVLIHETLVPDSPPFADVRTAIREVLLNNAGLLAWAGGNNPWSKEFSLKIYEFGAPVDIEDVEVRIQDGGTVPTYDWNATCQWYTARFFVWVMYTAANTSIPEVMLSVIQNALSGLDLVRTDGVSGNKVCVRNIVYLGDVEPAPQLNGWGVASLYRARVASL